MNNAPNATLSKKAARLAAFALAASAASGLAHGTAAVMHFHRPVDIWSAWIEMAAMAALAVGIAAGFLAYLNAPATPPGWRPARHWTFERLAPPAVYVSLLILTFAVYKSANPEISELAWNIGSGTASQFAFALVVWENWWCWKQFAISSPTAPAGLGG